MSQPLIIIPEATDDAQPAPLLARLAQSQRRRKPAAKKRNPNRDLKWGIWAYFLLLIFEGALRKWGSPALATPLLVVRDPIALVLLAVAYNRGKLPLNPYVIGMGAIGILGMLTAITLGHGSLPVAVYGARLFLLHFPLLFVIGRVFRREDVLKIGKATLWIAIPMTVLIGLQFYSPQSAWVNRGLAGDVKGAGFSGALGFSRPPGTFSFTNGTTLFYGFLSPFVCYFWLEGKKVSKLLLLAATAGLVAAIPLSISRGLLFQVGVTLIFAILAISRRPRYAGRMIVATVSVIMAIGVLSNTSFFGIAVEAFTARFETASEHEGGLEGTLVDRFLGGLAGALMDSGQQPIFGYGLGMGTNVGAMLLSGSRIFLIAEEEWGRTVGELGPILGLGVISLRLALAWKLALASYLRLVAGDLLPWLLLSIGLLTVAQGGWAQPTALGFFTITGGLLIASLKSPEKLTRKSAARDKRCSTDP